MNKKTSAIIGGALFIWMMLILNVWAGYDAPIGRVSDFANVLNDSTKQQLATKLKALDDKTTDELVVVTVPSLNGDDVANYTVLLAKKWQIGKKDKNNGVVFLIAPKEHRMRIEVGYGLESTLPDATAKRILDEIVVPYFKKGDFNGGITAGVDSIIKVLNKEDLTLQKKDDKSVSATQVAVVIIIVILLIIVIALFVGAGSIGGGGFLSGGDSDGGFFGGGGGFGGGGASGGW